MKLVRRAAALGIGALGALGAMALGVGGLTGIWLALVPAAVSSQPLLGLLGGALLAGSVHLALSTTALAWVVWHNPHEAPPRLVPGRRRWRETRRGRRAA